MDNDDRKNSKDSSPDESISDVEWYIHEDVKLENVRFDRMIIQPKYHHEVENADGQVYVYIDDGAVRVGRRIRRSRRVPKALTATLASASPPDSRPLSVPRAGELLAGLFCRKDLREALLGDLNEKFEERALARGIENARAWYWWQVARTFGAFAGRWVVRLIEIDALLQRIRF